MKLLFNQVLYCIRFVYNFNKTFVILSVFVGVVASFLANMTVYLNRYFLDSLVKLDLFLIIIFFSVICLLEAVQSVVELSYGYFKNIQDEKFNIYREEKLINNISKLSLQEREHPRFMSEMRLWSLGSSKIYASYENSIDIIQASITTIISLVIIFKGFWLIGFLILFYSLIKGFVQFKIIDPLVQFNRELAKKHSISDYFSSLLKTRDAQKEILLYKSFSFLKKKWLDAKFELLALSRAIFRINIKPTIISNLVSLLSKLCVYITLTYLLITKDISVGEFVSLTLTASLAEGNILTLMNGFKVMIEQSKYINDYLILIDKEEEMNEAKNLEKHISINRISIKNLSFYYPNQVTPALSNFNLEINKGEKVAIIGDNAAGKSTLIKIILGLYKAPEGTIYYNDIDQTKTDLPFFWTKCGVIFQDFTKYKMSLRENITLGRQDISEYNIKKMLTNLKMNKFLETKGLDANLGDIYSDSVELSGGEWQKIALSRLLCGDTELTILDEPTSALDPLSEYEILNELIEINKDNTTIIVTHRIGIASKVDRIVYMKNGSIIEEGSHNELIEKRGEYHETWNKQIGWYANTNATKYSGGI